MNIQHMCKTAGITLLSLVFLSGCLTSDNSEPSDTSSITAITSTSPSSNHGLHVEGTTLKHADGSDFVMRGVNHSHTWYRQYDSTAIDAIAATGANTIRLVFSNGNRWEKDSADDLKNLIEHCRSRGMVSVVEVHDATGSDDVADLLDAAQYWCSMADTLNGTEDYCILNIANEWCGSWNSRLWRDGYVQAIAMLREAGIRNCIMIDTAGWGQYGKAVQDYGKAVFDADPDRNTLFSIHMYGTSGRTERLIRNNLNGVTKQNLCVCVGEFGWTHTDGDVQEDYLMEYCDQNQIGWLAWSWKGNSGGVEYLDMANEWDGSNLTDWGKKVITGPYGIQQ